MAGATDEIIKTMNQEIKTMDVRKQCCTVCGYPTAARLQICSVACLSKYRRGRRTIRGTATDEDDTSEAVSGLQIINLAEV